MNSLLIRLLALCVVVGVLAGVVCLWIGVRSVTRTLHARQEVVTGKAGQEVLREVVDLQLQLEFEVGDYAQWDELYEHAPAVDPGWARINLVPGKNPGRLCQAMALIDGGRVVGRFDYRGPRGAEAAPGDMAAADALIAVCAGRDARGLAWFDGHPALWVAKPVTHSDATGSPHGQLVGLAYLTPVVVARLAPFGWEAVLRRAAEPTAVSDQQQVRSSVALPGSDAPVTLEITQPRDAEQEIRVRLVHDIALASLALPVLASAIGMLLIWRWIAPLRELSAACHRYSTDPDAAIPDGGEFTETRELARALRDLVAAERQARKRMAADLAGAESAQALQRSRLQHMAGELAGAMRIVQSTSRRLSGSGGVLPPEEVAALEDAVENLQIHIQDVVGLGRNEGARPDAGATDLAAYAEAVAELLRDSAARSRASIAVAVSGRARVDASLLTPVLINLLANAIAAAPGSEIRLRGGVGEGGAWWEVEDHGPGLPAALADTVAAACSRGSVLPGDKALGLGLALVVAHTSRAGGRIRLLRNDAQGALFRIELPAV